MVKINLKGWPIPVLGVLILVVLLIAGFGWNVFGFWPQRVFQIALAVCFVVFCIDLGVGIAQDVKKRKPPTAG